MVARGINDKYIVIERVILLKNNYSLVSAFEKSIFEPIVELSSSLLEVGLDEITENEVIKQIPVVSSMVSIYKITMTIRERYFLKKTMQFIIHFNHNLNKEEAKRYQDKIENDNKLLQKEIERIIVLIDRYVEQEKTKYLANLYKKYIYQNVDCDWNDFCVLSETLDEISIYDIEELKQLYEAKIFESKVLYNKLAMSRLSSLGLVDYYYGMTVSNQKEPNKQIVSAITDYGNIFYEYVLEEMT